MSRAGDARRREIAATRLYLIVTPAASPAWETAARDALATGLVGAVQLREKEGDAEAFLALADRLRPLAVRAGALFLLNDRVHLVRAARADGVHVGEGDPSPADARASLGPDLLVGVSTHDEREVRAAAAGGVADYAGLGPCFATETKRLSRAPGGADLVRRCAPLAGALPLFPIGGIDAENAADLAAAGATRLAVGSAVLGAPDPAALTRALDRILREPRGG